MENINTDFRVQRSLKTSELFPSQGPFLDNSNFCGLKNMYFVFSCFDWITQKSGNSNFEDTRKYIRMEWYLSFNRCPIGAVTRAAEPAGFEPARKREVCDAGDTCS